MHRKLQNRAILKCIVKQFHFFSCAVYKIAGKQAQNKFYVALFSLRLNALFFHSICSHKAYCECMKNAEPQDCMF